MHHGILLGTISPSVVNMLLMNHFISFTSDLGPDETNLFGFIGSGFSIH